MAAFTDIVMGTDLLAQIESAAPYTLYVVGHSLGGAMATTVALFLQQLVSAGTLSITSILPYTFAAPTAGDATFASWFDSQFPGAVCTYNTSDLVPNAWATLKSLPWDYLIGRPLYPGENSKPSGPGPTAEPANEVGILLITASGLTNGNTYVQPTQQAALNDLVATVPAHLPLRRDIGAAVRAAGRLPACGQQHLSDAARGPDHPGIGPRRRLGQSDQRHHGRRQAHR